jgi:holliday junction DNA helicase RuvA
VQQLEKVKGIGKKTAERLVLELKDKIGKIVASSHISELSNNSLEQDALNALQALGIAKPIADKAIKQVLKQEPMLEKAEDIIKKALKNL